MDKHAGILNVDGDENIRNPRNFRSILLNSEKMILSPFNAEDFCAHISQQPLYLSPHPREYLSPDSGDAN